MANRAPANSGTPHTGDVFWEAVKALFWLVAAAALLAVPWVVALNVWLHWGIVALGALLAVYSIREFRDWRRLYRFWRYGPEGNADDRFGPIDPNQFMRLLRRRGRVRRYLQRTFGSRIAVRPVLRAATLELWHNLGDIDNYLGARDPRNQQTIDADEWFLRIAHNLARDYVERNGNLSGTAQGVFLEFVRQRLGIWDRLGLAGERRTADLAREFHAAIESLPPRLVPILEGDLNMNLIVAAERRLGQSDLRREQALKMLREALGLPTAPPG